MTFSTNHPILFLLAGILVAVVLGQSVYFLVKALRRSKQIGMDQTKIAKTIKTAAIFTVAPAVSIVISEALYMLTVLDTVDSWSLEIARNANRYCSLSR